ncbi:hypothetical protein [Fusibacter sp. 3D3]|uniref:hypothetical protein n=1 Tax=Fusibacter sp. 3D3 TaxID=1048380 RepID=UPI0008537A41|nr:hypothetical protein [Fusibacter sp. 3D3]GAU75900.1 hypothetical protein F3D3_0496 [Fusibacter sp. 3D3]
MPKHIFVEENRNFKIITEYADEFIELNAVYHKTILSDVDLIIAKDNEVILMEYKNANVPNASNPEVFEEKLSHDDHYKKIARKYYDSLIYVANSELKADVKKFYYVIEAKNLDSVLRARIAGKIKMKLPFGFKSDLGLLKSFIDEFHVVSIEEWNNVYSEYAFTAC